MSRAFATIGDAVGDAFVSVVGPLPPWPVDRRPLWERALEARRLERSAKSPRRIHAIVQVGDVFGDFRVVALLPRGFRGRSDERVTVECMVCVKRWGEHGVRVEARRDAFVGNLRQKAPRCRLVPKNGAPR